MQPAHSAPAVMPGVRTDLLSADQGHVYLRDHVFDRQGRAQPEGRAHIFSLTGFLDDDWPHRAYWIFGTECLISTGCSQRGDGVISGRLLAMDESTVYGYGREKYHWSNRLEDGPYRLFAVTREEGEAKWAAAVPIRIRAMLVAGDILFAAGPPVEGSEESAAILMAVSTTNGTVLAKQALRGAVQFDGMAAADGRLYIAMEDGHLVCLGTE